MATQPINHENVHRFCRTCLSAIGRDPDLEDTKYNIIYNIQNNPNVAKWFNICTSLDFQRNVNYPKCICLECYEKLKSYYDFRDMCIQSTRTLDGIFAEPSEDNESGTQILIVTTKKELCDEDDTTQESSNAKDFEEVSKLMKKFQLPEYGEEDDKSSIRNDLQTMNSESNKYVDENKTNTILACKGVLENSKPFEYKNCNEVSAVDQAKLLDVADYIDMGKNINISEDKVKDDHEAIKYAKVHILNKSELNFKGKHSAPPKKKKKSLSPVKDTKMLILNTELKVSKGKFSCTLCDNKFYKQNNLDAHIRRDHQGLKPFQCDKCECGYNKAYRLKLHINRVHGNAVNEEVICKVEGCGKKFRNNASYKTHYHNKHTERANLLRTFICEDCGSSFKNMISLKKHRYKHGPPEAYPFHCDRCDKRFSTKYKYKQHQDRHAGIKNFECPYCGLKKTTNDELRTHINYHTKERQWPCPDCTSVFNSSGSLGQHYRIVHQRIRRYSCRYCGDSFAKPETLKHHEMRHTGEKPHECQICGKRFIQSVALRTHLKTHGKSERKINNNVVKPVVETDKSTI